MAMPFSANILKVSLALCPGASMTFRHGNTYTLSPACETISPVTCPLSTAMSVTLVSNSTVPPREIISSLIFLTTDLRISVPT